VFRTPQNIIQPHGYVPFYIWCLTWASNICPPPGLDHIFIRLGPVQARPSHAFFTARSSCPHPHGNSSPLGTNSRSLKPLGSLGMWRNSINKLGNDENNVNLDNCNFGWVLSHWFPTRNNFYTWGSGSEGGGGEGAGQVPTEWRCDLARAHYLTFHEKKLKM